MISMLISTFNSLKNLIYVFIYIIFCRGHYLHGCHQKVLHFQKVSFFNNREAIAEAIIGLLLVFAVQRI